MKLVIVESYSKTKIIEKYLGKEYKVIACGGHIQNLNSKHISIDFRGEKFIPKYTLLPKKKKFLDDIKKGNYEEIIIASDQDLEGAFIAYSLMTHLKLNLKNKHRVIFPEITKDVVQKEIHNKSVLDINLVNSQMARRMIDRLIGYKFQKLLDKGYSIGRVQSSLLYLIYQNNQNHRKDMKFSYILELDFGNKIKSKISVEESNFTQKYCENILSHPVFNVIERKINTKYEFALKPLNTSDLQKSAYQKLGFNSKTTMALAQSLYQKGFITYIRTTSNTISSEFISKVKHFILDKYGKKYFHLPKQTKKSQNNQEAHECIRFTSFDSSIEMLEGKEKKLYSLIKNHTLKACMSAAIYDVETILLSNKIEIKCLIEDKVLTFEGFKIIDSVKVIEENLQEKKKKDKYILKKIMGNQIYKYSNILFNESSVINEMEKHGIGRPSTFSSSIQLILDKQYVKIEKKVEGIEVDSKELVVSKTKSVSTQNKKIVGEEKNKFCVTDKGTLLIQYLEKNLPEIINIEYTSLMENKLDLISQNKHNYQHLVKENDDYIESKLNSVSNLTNSNQHKKSTNRSLLGVDKNGNELSLGKSQYGYYIMKKYIPENKIQFFSVTSNKTNLEKALEITNNSYFIGTFKKKDVFYKDGFITYGKEKIKVPRTQNKIKLENIKRLL